MLIPRAVVLPRPLQQLQVIAHSSEGTRILILFAAVLPRPLQDLKVPVHGGVFTR